MLLAGLVAAPAAHADAPVANRSSLKQDLCYQIATDRFVDGDAANNNPAKSPGLYDASKSNWKQYWGGDFAGIQQKLTYLKNMGVTAIWISPHVDNVDVPVVYNGVTNTGYHGYWTRDFKKTPNYPNWFGVASVPACMNIQFKFVKIASGGAVTWEAGANHAMMTPCSGTSAVTVTWQN